MSEGQYYTITEPIKPWTLLYFLTLIIKEILKLGQIEKERKKERKRGKKRKISAGLTHNDALPYLF